jgi:nitroimidazol reductase NimA-like FMN-containing flavoprotein (pyridoxamine 5'-phosphate oxidase superfamily)
MSNTIPSNASSAATPSAAGDAAPQNPSAPPSARTRVRRIPEYARYDTAAVHAIVDAAFLCHIAFSSADGVHCIPTACWRQDRHLLIHGSNGSRMIKALQSGAEAAVNITLIDGLVLARSAFNHAMNYRSVVIYGQFTAIPDSEKAAAVAGFLQHILPGRQELIRPGSAKELAATTVLRIALDEAAAKVRVGVPEDDAEDMDWPVWAGVLPLALLPQAPQRDPLCAVPPPEHVQAWQQRRFDGVPAGGAKESPAG